MLILWWKLSSISVLPYVHGTKNSGIRHAQLRMKYSKQFPFIFPACFGSSCMFPLSFSFHPSFMAALFSGGKYWDLWVLLGAILYIYICFQTHHISAVHWLLSTWHKSLDAFVSWSFSAVILSDVVFQYPPFLFIDYHPNGTRAFRGICWDLLVTLGAALNFTWVTMPFYNILYTYKWKQYKFSTYLIAV